MPSKAKTTKQMVLDAAFAIVRSQGVEAVSVRSIARALECSTQPITYLFSTTGELMEELYRMADAYHTRYIMDLQGAYETPLLEIGMRCIRFAATESALFRFLFQTNHYQQKRLDNILDEDESGPILDAMAQGLHASREQAKRVFMPMILLVQGFSAMIANNAMIYDEAFALRVLGDAFDGAMYVFEKGKTKKGKPEMDSLPQP